MAEEKKIINFMGIRRVIAGFSVVLVVVSILSLAVNGLNFGLDFTGGTQIEVGYSEPADLTKVRSTLESAGYEGAVAVHFGSDRDVLVRLAEGYSDTLGAEVLAVLQKDSEATVELRRIEFVGPAVGGELRDQGGLALLAALLVVLVYVTMRFQFKFSIGAVIALIHDVIITLGVFSILQWDFDLTVLAALLAVIGYSLNDTIVVSDRIRENFRKIRKGDSLFVINTSLTQTLGRTVVTSLTTLLVLFALFFVGGEMIHAFSQALIVGVLIGTYSSIYVAANVLIAMNISKEDLMLPVKEGEEFDAAP